MTQTIRIDDLDAPVLTPLQRAALERAAASPARVTEQTILDAAVGATGLDDFGSDDFLERLRVWMSDVVDDPEVTDYGRNEFFAGCVRYATTRLRVRDLLVRHPEILDVPIVRPIIVVGLPRSGTTHLLNVLAADTRLRSLPLWEAFEPVPLPGEPVSDDEADPRYQRSADRWEATKRLLPSMAAMHPMTPDHVHEETELMLPDFSSYFVEWWFRAPRWRDYYLGHDQTPHYRYLKVLLQLLQWRRGPQRWVLKTPQHLEQLVPLMRVFPDADVVMTHRDPLAVVQSAATMVTYSSRLRYRRTDPAGTGRYWADRVGTLLDASRRDLHLVPNAVHVRFHEFMADEMATIERIYDSVGWPFDDDARDSARRHLRGHQRGKDGRMTYDLATDFELDIGELRRRFEPYCEATGVEQEVQ
jgi:Sulfotransferase family